jgi:hypothetical protein
VILNQTIALPLLPALTISNAFVTAQPLNQKTARTFDVADTKFLSDSKPQQTGCGEAYAAQVPRGNWQHRSALRGQTGIRHFLPQSGKCRPDPAHTRVNLASGSLPLLPLKLNNSL